MNSDGADPTQGSGGAPGQPTPEGPGDREVLFLRDLREAFLGHLRWFVGVSRTILRPEWGDAEDEDSDSLGEFLDDVEDPELRDSAMFRAIASLHARVSDARHALHGGGNPSSYDRFAALFLRLAETVERAKAETVLALAGTDRLTGLPNRSAMDADLERAQHAHRLLTVAIADIDHFKLINDRLGHLAGDKVLASVAQRLADNARGGDRVYRFGGDEFLLLLPGADEQRAWPILERVLRAVAAESVPPEVEGVSLTLSVGFSVWRRGGARSVKEVLGLADTHLYRAKEAGRNRVSG